MSYGQKIRSLREAKKLTQQDLANMADVHVNTLARAEKNQGIGVNQLAKIAAALDMPPAYFLA